jgi:hypothetical protein
MIAVTGGGLTFPSFIFPHSNNVNGTWGLFLAINTEFNVFVAN